ncbi:hypothetical protein PPERSA_04593 [Pseudocohnilembus persalinus]|uniref:Insulin-like growth factor binding protein, N-terminal n=1 Tax=Pseudocohnilembus persalinus TaxID=266149 RepID=A0A0V0QAR5_PSEPJ|nr:hypothetical protein PPERSA_04593 [Pseudocohnilembus persalinus]|eukprot:KRW99231.1 hypothetical protein PPERSA_04593 [Pseudocohnilembus persalinus]
MSVQFCLYTSFLMALAYSTACTSSYQCGYYDCNKDQQTCYDTCTDGNDIEKCKTNYCVNSKCEECTSDADSDKYNTGYPSNTYCIENYDGEQNNNDKCVECLQDSYCNTNFVCNTSKNECETTCDTSTNQGCAEGYLCSGGQYCIECFDDDNCSDNFKCDNQIYNTSNCCTTCDVETSIGCTCTTVCDDGIRCVRCIDDSNCFNNEICVSNECLKKNDGEDKDYSGSIINVSLIFILAILTQLL